MIDYETLLKEERNLLNDVSLKQVTYETQFRFNELNQVCNKCMLIDQYNVETLSSNVDLFSKIPALQSECQKCKEFFITRRAKCAKKFDLEYGKEIEKVIIDYLCKHNIKAVFTSSINKDLCYPDITILDTNDNIAAYLEIKYHAAPFIASEKFVGIPCYSSISMDFTKIKNQIELIKRDISVPVYYVHWIDFPCIKGIFFEDFETVEKIMNETGCEFIRKEKTGDYVFKNSKLQKCGHTDKFYVNPARLEPFEILMNNLDKLTHVQSVFEHIEFIDDKHDITLYEINNELSTGLSDDPNSITNYQNSKSRCIEEIPFCKQMYDNGYCRLDPGIKCTCKVTIDFDRKSFVLTKPEWCKDKKE